MRTEEHLRGWYSGVKYAVEMIKSGKLTLEFLDKMHPDYYEKPEKWITEEQFKKEDVWGDGY
jgi:hypothetical protein